MELQRKPKKRPSSNPPKGSGPRDLSALLTHGASLWPYTGAWTASRIEQVRHFREWVYVAVSTIAEQIASHKPNISYVYYKDKSKGEKFYMNGCQRTKALTPLQSHEDLEPIEYNHPLSRLLDDPNDPDTAYDLWYETVLFLLLTGSAYWWMPKNKLGLPAALWNVPSHWVWPIPGKDVTIESYEVRPVEGNYIRKVVPADEIIHFRLKNPISRIDGNAPLEAIGIWCDVQESIYKAQWHTYQNGIFPTVAVEFSDDLNDLSDEQIRRIEAKIITRQTGPSRSNKPIYVPPGMKLKPISLAPNEMVFGETAEHTRDNILAAYKVPHIVAGIMGKMTYGSILAAQAGFMSFCINPKLSFLGQVTTEKIAIPYYSYENTSLRIWFEDKTPEDPQLLEERTKTDLLCGAITPNERRAMIGREPLPYPWADKPILPVNMQPGALPGGGKHGDGKNDNPVDMPKISDEKSFENFILNHREFVIKNGY